MTDREIMQQALDALEMHVLGFDGVRKMELAIEALEAALAQPDETETLKRCLFQMQEAAKVLAQPEQAPKLSDAGADTNISRGLEPKGSGMVTLHQPVAWMMPDYGDVLSASEADGTGIYNVPLYTAPPKREWVGLTNEEIANGQAEGEARSFKSAVRWVEAKLKEKNNGSV